MLFRFWILFFFVLLGRLYAESLPEITLKQNNLISALSRMNRLDKSLHVVVHDREEVVLINHGSGNEIAAYIAQNRKKFRKEIPAVSKLFHGSKESYRQIAKPSLHFTYYAETDIWKVHFDKWCPRFTAPLTIAAHFSMEVLPHILFGSQTSQIAIQKMLKRKEVVW